MGAGAGAGKLRGASKLLTIADTRCQSPSAYQSQPQSQAKLGQHTDSNTYTGNSLHLDWCHLIRRVEVMMRGRWRRRESGARSGRDSHRHCIVQEGDLRYQGQGGLVFDTERKVPVQSEVEVQVRVVFEIQRRKVEKSKTRERENGTRSSKSAALWCCCCSRLHVPIIQSVRALTIQQYLVAAAGKGDWRVRGTAQSGTPGPQDSRSCRWGRFWG